MNVSMGRGRQIVSNAILSTGWLIIFVRVPVREGGGVRKNPKQVRGVVFYKPLLKRLTGTIFIERKAIGSLIRMVDTKVLSCKASS